MQSRSTGGALLEELAFYFIQSFFAKITRATMAITASIQGRTTPSKTTHETKWMQQSTRIENRDHVDNAVIKEYDSSRYGTSNNDDNYNLFFCRDNCTYDAYGTQKWVKCETR